MLAIVGGSSCGKSTLLRLVAGARPAELWRSAARRRTGAGSARGDRPRLPGAEALPWLDGRDVVGFGLADRPEAERRAMVRRALQRVGLADKARAWPRQLSGGNEKERSA